MDKNRPFRQWYLMSDDDRNRLFADYGTDKFSFEPHQVETANYTPYMKKNSDFIKGLDIAQNHANKLSTESIGTLPAAKLFIHRFDVDSDQNEGALRGPDIRGGTYGHRPGEDDTFGLGTWYDDETHAGKQGLQEWHTVIGEYLPRQWKALERTRKIAATASGVDWKGYVDWDHDLPPAGSSDELQQQLDSIQKYNDRTTPQKNYLGQKAITRWMMKSAGDMGYGKGISRKLYEKDSISGMQTTR